MRGFLWNYGIKSSGINWNKIWQLRVRVDINQHFLWQHPVPSEFSILVEAFWCRPSSMANFFFNIQIGTVVDHARLQKTIPSLKKNSCVSFTSSCWKRSNGTTSSRNGISFSIRISTFFKLMKFLAVTWNPLLSSQKAQKSWHSFTCFVFGICNSLWYELSIKNIQSLSLSLFR